MVKSNYMLSLNVLLGHHY